MSSGLAKMVYWGKMSQWISLYIRLLKSKRVNYYNLFLGPCSEKKLTNCCHGDEWSVRSHPYRYKQLTYLCGSYLDINNSYLHISNTYLHVNNRNCRNTFSKAFFRALCHRHILIENERRYNQLFMMYKFKTVTFDMKFKTFCLFDGNNAQLLG